MVRRLLVSAVVAAAASLGCPAPAAAHTSLAASTPAAGAVVHPETGAVEMVFSGAVQPALSTVVVTGPDGADVSSGSPSATGPRLVQPVTAPLAPGSWTVSYRVMAADGHPVTGSLTFQVRADVEPAAVQEVPTGSSTRVDDAAAPGTGAQTSNDLLLVVAGLVGAALVGLLAALRGRRSAASSGA